MSIELPVSDSQTTPREQDLFRISPVPLLLCVLLWGGIILWLFVGSTLHIKHALPYIIDCLYAAGIFGCVVVTGFFVASTLNILDGSTAVERAVLCCTFGAGALSYLVLAAGLMGLLYREVFYLVAVLCAAAGTASIVRRRPPSPRPGTRAADGRWELVLYACLAVLLMYSFVTALAPVADYDTMVYHYGLPNIFVQEHRVRYVPENIFSGFPQTMEMLYTLAILVRGYEVATLMEFGISVVFLLLVFAFAGRYYDRPTGLLAALLVYSSPLVAFTFFRPGADMAMALFSCLMLFLLVRWFETRHNRWLTASALCCGLALATKYTALFFCAGIGMLMLAGYMVLHRFRAREVLLRLTVFFLLAAAVASPWYIKNWMTTGNPFFPAFYDLFGGEDYSPAMAQRQLVDANHSGQMTVAGFAGLPAQMLRAPYTYGNPVGCCFFLFWPFLLFLRRSPLVTIYVVFFVLAYFALWAWSFQLARFMIAAVGGSAILCAHVFERLRRSRSWLVRYSAMIIIITAVGLNTAFFLNRARIIHDPFPVVFGAVSKGDYLRRYLSPLLTNRFEDFADIYRSRRPRREYSGDLQVVLEYMNKNLTQHDKTLFLGETFHAYLKKPCVCPSPFNRNPLVVLIQRAAADDEIKRRLRASGITHILFNIDELKRLNLQGYCYQLSSDDLRNLRGFLYRCTGMEFKEGNILLLKLRDDAQR